MAFLELTQRIDAPLPLLWHYISTSEGLSAWHADHVEGSIAQGNFQVSWPRLNAKMELKVDRAEPLRVLALRAGQSSVTLSLSHGGVHLVHDGLDDDDDLAGFRSSWSLALSLLAHAVSRHPERARHVGWVFERAPTTPELVHFYFSDALGLRQWLGTTSRDIGGVGDNVVLELGGGVHLHGRVLSHEPGRDLALSWRELDDAALVLRTLPASSGDRSLSLSLSTYGNPAPNETMKLLERSLGRLSETLRGRGRS